MIRFREREMRDELGDFDGDVEGVDYYKRWVSNETTSQKNIDINDLMNKRGKGLSGSGAGGAILEKLEVIYFHEQLLTLQMMLGDQEQKQLWMESMVSVCIDSNFPFQQNHNFKFYKCQTLCMEPENVKKRWTSSTNAESIATGQVRSHRLNKIDCKTLEKAFFSKNRKKRWVWKLTNNTCSKW